MLEINWDDVRRIFDLIIPYLIGFGVVVLIATVAMIIVRKKTKKTRFIVRGQSLIIIFIALIITSNLIAYGPLSTILTLASGRGTISIDSGRRAELLGEEIASEGIVLLENNGLLPLEQETNLNVFGWASTNPVYGGTGSGALSDDNPTISLLDGLRNAGFNLNDNITNLYTDFNDARPVVGLFEQDWTLPEPPTEMYSESLLEEATQFSSTALVVISRAGGEGPDLPHDMGDESLVYNNNSESYDDFGAGTHYLELSQSERNMIELVTENFDDIVLVYNGANAMELNFVEEFEEIKSVLWVPSPGQNGFDALGDIVSGVVNPSGKSADTFVYDLLETPYINNIGNFEYENVDEFIVESEFTDGIPTFVNYVEGIYVGYRFYETAAEEGLIEYDDTVQYPFGHGLSYTEFEKNTSDLNVTSDGNITMDVTVTNTGSVAGKDIVQVYYTPPYENGGIEKAAVNLVAFDKTGVLNPGESQTVTLSFHVEDMASYDSSEDGAWVLEAGDYDISVRLNSHEVIDNQVYTVENEIVYNEENSRSTDLISSSNKFQFAKGDVTYLSRENSFENYEEAIQPPSTRLMNEETKEVFINDSNYDPVEYNDSEDEMPTTGADNGYELLDMRGLDYDDDAWEPLLDQLTVEEMRELIALGGYQTGEIESISKGISFEFDGPASIINNFTGVASIGFPSAVMMANTWNEDLIYEFGDSIGEMANEMNVSGWYAPGANLHRSAFAGRNFEYYSEDGLLSGKMASNAIQGAKNRGVFAYIKHFALNDQEVNRWRMLLTWANEQSMREVYFKPFELAVKEGETTAIMSAYNYVGHEWAGASDSLLNGLLREEWGFNGTVISDYFAGFGFMDADWMIRNGGDLALINYDLGSNYVDDTESATSVQAMRQATKNILYTSVNSRAYGEDALNQGMPLWQIIAIVVNVISALIVISLEILIYKKIKKNDIEKENEPLTEN